MEPNCVSTLLIGDLLKANQADDMEYFLSFEKGIET